MGLNNFHLISICFPRLVTHMLLFKVPLSLKDLFAQVKDMGLLHEARSTVIAGWLASSHWLVAQEVSCEEELSPTTRTMVISLDN